MTCTATLGRDTVPLATEGRGERICVGGSYLSRRFGFQPATSDAFANTNTLAFTSRPSASAPAAGTGSAHPASSLLLRFLTPTSDRQNGKITQLRL